MISEHEALRSCLVLLDHPWSWWWNIKKFGPFKKCKSFQFSEVLLCQAHTIMFAVVEKKKEGAALPVWDTPVCATPLLLWLSLSRSVSLSFMHIHTHLSANTRRTHSDAHTFASEVTIPVWLRQHDSYFLVFTCSAQRRGRWKQPV